MSVREASLGIDGHIEIMVHGKFNRIGPALQNIFPGSLQFMLDMNVGRSGDRNSSPHPTHSMDSLISAITARFQAIMGWR